VYQQSAFTFPDDLDFKTVVDIHVYNGFILPLPFRLRTGPFFSVHVSDSFDVILRNRLAIPHGTPSDDVLRMMWEGKNFRPREQFFTEALVLDKNPLVTANFRGEFVAYMESTGDHKMPGTGARYFEATTSLNDAIVGYHHATKSLFGGTAVERVTQPAFFERLRYLHTIVCPSKYELSQENLIEVLDARGEREFTQLAGQFTTSQLDDVPASQLAQVQRYAQLNQRFLFYQFALDAKSRMVEQDYVSAILFAVVALEGVHSALLQMRLYRQMAASITDADIRAKQAEATANRLLKDVGFSESLEMTSLLFLDPEDRPREDELRNCKLGITIRNEIMHALAKKGQYRLRNRTNQQISEAYSSVLKVFDHFAAIVERDSEVESMA
jgi:hypothetical protein